MTEVTKNINLLIARLYSESGIMFKPHDRKLEEIIQYKSLIQLVDDDIDKYRKMEKVRDAIGEDNKTLDEDQIKSQVDSSYAAILPRDSFDYRKRLPTG